MHLFRFVVLALFVVMLLPTGEETAADRTGQDRGFCSRYPNTCAASGEIYTAFRKKLSYGVATLRDLLRSHSNMTTYDRLGAARQAPMPDDAADRTFGARDNAPHNGRLEQGLGQRFSAEEPRPPSRQTPWMDRPRPDARPGPLAGDERDPAWRHN